VGHQRLGEHAGAMDLQFLAWLLWPSNTFQRSDEADTPLCAPAAVSNMGPIQETWDNRRIWALSKRHGTIE
jgi:hypothetical protein